MYISMGDIVEPSAVTCNVALTKNEGIAKWGPGK